jgi:hypothetical protein
MLHVAPHTQSLSSFERLLLLRALRPDRMISALNAFVRDHLGQEYVLEEPFAMRNTFQESSPSTPIFFVLFPGPMALRCVALRCVALRCVALRCVALRCAALRCVALRCE